MDDRTRAKRPLALRLALAALQLLVTLALVYFVFERAGDLLAGFEFSDLRGREPLLALSGVLFAAFYGLLAWHWAAVCRQFDAAVSPRIWLSLFAAQPYKYLPSSLFTLSFRAKYAHDQGMALRPSTKAQLVENGNIIGAGAAVGAVAILAGYRPALGLLAGAVAAAAALLGLTRRSAVAIPRIGALGIARETRLFLLCAAAWTVAGAAFWTLLLAFHSTLGLASVIGINALAFVAGLLVVFAPGGLGIRELIFAIYGIANPAIALWRLVTLAVDVLTGAIAIAAIRITRSRQRSN